MMTTRRRGYLLVAVSVISALVLIASIWLRSLAVNQATADICAKLDLVVLTLEGVVATGATPPKPGDYGYTYWLHAPPVEQADRLRNPKSAIDRIHELSCNPGAIPKVKVPLGAIGATTPRFLAEAQR